MNTLSTLENNNKDVGKKISKPIIIIEEDISSNKILEPYKEQEYIPGFIINPFIKCSFISSTILHEYTGYHKIIKIKINDLLNAPIANWQYNRPPDFIRCKDIANYIYKSKTPIDTMLYLSFNNKTQTFDIIDGIHRYTSLKIINEYNSKPLDLITPSDFGNNNDANWLYNSYIIINIRFNALDGELIELFKNLNKSNPIPDLYIRDENKEKREIIENVVNEWQKKYPTHFSSKPKPYKPNINRDRLIDLLEIIYDKYEIKKEDKMFLSNLLERTNTNISYNVPRKIMKTTSIHDKCVETGCWLFIYSMEELVKLI
jgi:hypothetical protein